MVTTAVERIVAAKWRPAPGGGPTRRTGSDPARAAPTRRRAGAGMSVVR